MIAEAAAADGVLKWTEARGPERGVGLTGTRVDLVPLKPAEHAGALWRVSHSERDPELWRYLFYGPFESLVDFRAHLEECAHTEGAIFYTIVDEPSGKPAGIAAYLRIKPEPGVIEIGHVWFGVGMQRTAAATESVFLLAKHAFDELGFRRLEWKCDARNSRSRRTAARFGFAFEGIFRQHMIVKGRNRDTAWYAILDKDWPAIRNACQAWLTPENFDAQGRQRRRLGELREELSTEMRHQVGEGAEHVVAIRHAEEKDGPALRKMWTAYNRFYETSVPADVTRTTWKRILDESHPFGCLMAEFEGEAIGFANYVLGPYTWSRDNRCLMEDLWVQPPHRALGTGRALILALERRARAEGWTEVYWITKEDNLRARRLYESLTPADGFIQYTIETR